MRHGIGLLIKNNGEKYQGEWVRDKRKGQGQMIYKDGSIYIGYFNDNKRHG
jgi:hypothetical protein